MAEKTRIGVIGAGGIFRSRHFPGLAPIAEAEVVAICNRSEESGRKIAEEFGLEADIMTDPHALISRDDVDAVMVGTWPYKHAPFALEALEKGKHAFVQARMAMSLREAKQMYAMARQTGLVTQICPPPHCLKGDWFMRRMVREGYLGTIYGIYVRSMTGELADPNRPLHWRQIERYSGLNTLQLGMLVEFVHRWFGFASSVTAHAKRFTEERPLDEGGTAPVDRPDSVHILARMENGAEAVFIFSGVAQMASNDRIEAYGSDGTLIYELGTHRILGGRSAEKQLCDLAIPEDEAREWRVEQDFVDAIQGRMTNPESTFYEGVKYMEFTEAVFRSVESGATVNLPLVD